MAEHRAERRLITAMFVDVVGSTELTVRIGPERTRRELDARFAEIHAIVVGRGGIVEKYIGDAVFAIFGAPIAHADDPERALRAAEACARPVVDALVVRVGVETGEALLDLDATEHERQRMAVGMCVNVAARLQGLAEPGQVLVGPTCRAATEDLAEFTDLGERELKGIGPTRTSALARMRVAPDRARPVFVGRDVQYEDLRHAFDRACSGRSTLALVTGPAGQGKTRLVEELIAGHANDARVLVARCRPGDETGTDTPLRQLLASSLGDRGEDLIRRVAECFSEPAEGTRVATAIGHSAGIASSPQLSASSLNERRDEIANAWLRYLRTLARVGPLVMWVEDVHWADGELIRLLDRLTFSVDLPLLVVATARPEFRGTAGLRLSADRVFIELGPLDTIAATALAGSAGSVGRILERAQGNPLFILELARSRAGAMDELPVTLQGAIGARLDELAPGDREILQRTAVAGETFGVADTALLAERAPGDAAATLGRLVHLQFLQPIGASFRFHHGLVRDVAYGRLAAADRIRLHARYAREGVDPEDAEALAHHWWEALRPPDAEWVWGSDPGLAAMRREAVAAHLTAGRRHTERFAHQRAVEVLERALALADGAADEAGVHSAIGDAYGAAAQADDAWRHYLRAREIGLTTEEGPDPRLYADMLEYPQSRYGMFHEVPSDELVAQLFDEGEQLARRKLDRIALARLLVLRGSDRIDEALELAREGVEDAALGRILRDAAAVRYFSGDVATARSTYARAATLAPATLYEDPNGTEAAAALDAGELTQAITLADAFVERARSNGPHLRTHACAVRIRPAFACGDWAGVFALAEEIEQLVQANPGTAFCAYASAGLASASVARALHGDRARAEAALAAAERIPMPPLHRASTLDLGFAALGHQVEVEAMVDVVITAREQRPWDAPDSAVALALVGAWDALDPSLAELDRLAVNGNRLAAALAAGVREECEAARGGPAPIHEALGALGFHGWSEVTRRRVADRAP